MVKFRRVGPFRLMPDVWVWIGLCCCICVSCDSRSNADDRPDGDGLGGPYPIESAHLVVRFVLSEKGGTLKIQKLYCGSLADARAEMLILNKTTIAETIEVQGNDGVLFSVIGSGGLPEDAFVQAVLKGGGRVYYTHNGVVDIDPQSNFVWNLEDGRKEWVARSSETGVTSHIN